MFAHRDGLLVGEKARIRRFEGEEEGHDLTHARDGQMEPCLPRIDLLPAVIVAHIGRLAHFGLRAHGNTSRKGGKEEHCGKKRTFHMSAVCPLPKDLFPEAQKREGFFCPSPKDVRSRKCSLDEPLPREHMSKIRFMTVITNFANGQVKGQGIFSR